MCNQQHSDPRRELYAQSRGDGVRPDPRDRVHEKNLLSALRLSVCAKVRMGERAVALFTRVNGIECMKAGIAIFFPPKKSLRCLPFFSPSSSRRKQRNRRTAMALEYGAARSLRHAKAQTAWCRLSASLFARIKPFCAKHQSSWGEARGKKQFVAADFCRMFATACGECSTKTRRSFSHGGRRDGHRRRALQRGLATLPRPLDCTLSAVPTKQL